MILRNLPTDHGVFKWAILFRQLQPLNPLKKSCPANRKAQERRPGSLSRPSHATAPPLAMARRPRRTLRGHGEGTSEAMPKPSTARTCDRPRHRRPPFINHRIAIGGRRLSSCLTCAVVGLHAPVPPDELRRTPRPCASRDRWTRRGRRPRWTPCRRGAGISRRSSRRPSSPSSDSGCGRSSASCTR